MLIYKTKVIIRKIILVNILGDYFIIEDNVENLIPNNIYAWMYMLL